MPPFAPTDAHLILFVLLNAHCPGHAWWGDLGKEAGLEAMEDTDQEEEGSEEGDQEVETICKR